MTRPRENPSSAGAAGEQGETPDAADAFARMAAPMATLLENYARFMGQIAGGTPRTPATGEGAPGMGLPAALVEAGVIASASAARYGQRMTEVLVRHQAALYAAATAGLAAEEPADARKRADAELFQRFIREVSETALFEARRLEHELELLGEAVAQDAETPSPDAPYRRYWGVTP